MSTDGVKAENVEYHLYRRPILWNEIWLMHSATLVGEVL